MTPELQQRWQSGVRPFDGLVVVTRDEPTLADALEMLHFVFERLRKQNDDISVIADWHEHDGFLTPPTRTTWDEISTRLESTESFYQSRNIDDYVRIALFPDSFEWLLRYNIEDAEQDYGDAWCDLDFSCTPESHSHDLVNDLHSKWPRCTDVSPAKQFFDSSYGG